MKHSVKVNYEELQGNSAWANSMIPWLWQNCPQKSLKLGLAFPPDLDLPL